MSRLRLALALVALGLAAAPGTATAAGKCPSIISGPAPYYTCGLRSGSNCASCQYECSDGNYYWFNTCFM